MKNGSILWLVFAMCAGCSSSMKPGAVAHADSVGHALQCELRQSSGSRLLSPASCSHLHYLLFWKESGVKVYQDWNSWGYYERSLVGTDASNRAYELARRQTGFTKNYPSTDALNPGEFLITDLYPCDGSWYVSPKLSVGKGAILRLAGRFRISADGDAAKHGVWTGEIQSAPIEVYFDKNCVRVLNDK